MNIYFASPIRGIIETHPGDASDRLGDSSGAQSWPDFSTFLVRMVVGFLIDFRIFEIIGFGPIVRPVDLVSHSHDPFDGCDCQGVNSGGQSWSNFSTFMLSMVVGVWPSVVAIQPYLQPSRGNHG